MSGSQKQSATAGPQTQRYSNSPYQPILPQTATSFLGADPFSVASPAAASYVQQAQGPGQGSGLRGLPTSVPPNQSSTPPNVDIKVQNLPNQMPMQFVTTSVRPQTQYYSSPRAASGPSNQTPRMPNQQHRAQVSHTLYSPGPFLVPSSQMYLHNPFYNTGTQRPNLIQPTYPVYGQQLAAFQTYTHPQAPVSGYQFMYNQQPAMMSRTPGPQVTSAPPNPTQGTISVPPLIPSTQTHSTFHPKNIQRQRRPNALSVIDPKTGEDRLNEIFENNSHPASGESSACQTPQPVHPDPNKEIQAAFAKQVAQAANDNHDRPDEPSSLHEPPFRDGTFIINDQSVLTEYECHPSSLHINAKEFVSGVSSWNKSAKETTPIVSANSDAAEVIITKKDRESPAKSRKQMQRDHKPEVTKDIQSNDLNCEPCNPVVVVKEDKPKEIVTPPPPPINHAMSPVVVPPPQPVKEESKESEKKSYKKVQVESKAPEVAESVPQVPQLGAEVVSNGKSKQNAQRQSKQNANQAANQPQQKQQAPIQVPAPQPAKANNKSNKKNELNMKGANKEGTDMDAFNDNEPKNEVNANVVISSQNDIVNANTILPPAQVIPMVNPTEETVETTSATSELKNVEDSNEVTIKPDPAPTQIPAPVTVPPVQPTVVTKPTSKPFDVTSIIKEPPKSIVPPFSSLNDTEDEPDLALNSNDKIVMAKNDTNLKISNKSSYNDAKPQLPYREGQWTPDKPDGKKVYEKDFLLALQNYPASKRKPDNIPDVVLEDRSRPIDSRISMGGGGRADFTPQFQNYGSKSGSQKGLLPKQRISSSRMSNRGGSDKSGKPMPKVSISLKGDVKLHETENAWKPTRFVKGEQMTDEDKKTELLYKKVRAVLNKLTPQKFDALVGQVRQLQIDNKDRLKGVMGLVFEKAIDEPNFSVAYAMMCKELQIMQVPSGDDKKLVAFKTLLVTRCQQEFEKQSLDETIRNSKLKEIENCADPEKKKELTFELEEYDRKLRMKSVGTIRFIGELFKQQMLTASIMKRCLQTLLDNRHEESLECLCKLLTTVGKELEQKSIDLSGIFEEMKKISENKKQQKFSSRIRFMLQDVIELRDSKWVPRRGDTNPKTIDQIQKEAETEQFNIQAMNLNQSRKDDRGNSGPRQQGPRKNMSGEEGWNSVASRGRQTYTIQTDKLKTKMPLSDEPLGSRLLFGNWGKGSTGPKNQPEPFLGHTSTNIYAALENVDTEKRSMNTRSNKDPYNSKGPSMERSYKSSYDGRGSRSGSQHRADGNSTPMRTNAVPVSVPSQPSTPAAVKPSYPTPPRMSEDQMLRRLKNALEEYLNDCCTIDEYFVEIASTFTQSEHSKVVYETYNCIIEKSEKHRLKTGELFAKLINSGKLALEDFCSGFEELLSVVEDLEIDIPKVWTYIAENIVYLISEEALPISRLHKSFTVIIESGRAKRVLNPLFNLIISGKGPNFLQRIWQQSDLQLSDFIPSSEVSSFVNDNKLEFLVGGSVPSGQTHLSYEQVHSKLSEFLKNNTDFDDIVNWISANVGQCVTENKFIRVLATAIFEDSIQNNKLVNDILQSHAKLIQKYIDNNTNYELQCLYALQALVNQLEYPQGLLLSMCNCLYEESIFCQESFILWEESTDPTEQGGKGVCLKQLTSFFTQLKENEEDDESNSEDA